MNYAKRHSMLFNRERFPELVPVNAYESGLFFMEGDRDYIGACFVGSPLIGADDSTVEMIRSGLSGDCPDDTLVQVSFLSSSYIENLVRVYGTSRFDLLKRADGLTPEQKQTLWSAYQGRNEFLLEGARKAHINCASSRRSGPSDWRRSDSMPTSIWCCCARSCSWARNRTAGTTRTA